VDKVGERAEGLVDVRRLIRAVDLIQVDVVRAESAEAPLALLDDPPSRVSPMAAWTLVARTTRERSTDASALPTISSDSPPEYTSAVSMKLMPASSALWMMRTDSSWSGSPQDPNIIAPRHRGLTLMPVRPRP